MGQPAKSFVEQRQHERFDLGTEAVLHTKKGDREVIIENISVRGMKILSPEATPLLEPQLKINQDVTIEWASGVHIPATIVWSIRETAGVFFNEAIAEDHPLMVAAKANK